MLGIRRYQGVAIDLWQGDISLFVSDVQVAPTAAGLAQADTKGARHAALMVKGEDASVALAAVKAYLDGTRAGQALKRISFVLADGPVYMAFQEALFALFPEEDA